MFVVFELNSKNLGRARAPAQDLQYYAVLIKTKKQQQAAD
jgi:hypothetical protein